jgi:iron(II)-dependent oxidoreductase
MPVSAIRSPGLSTLRQELLTARRQTDALFQQLSPDAIYQRPVPDRHRLIFYLGHLDAFDWHLLALRTGVAPSFHPAFDRLFERGIDPAPGRASADSPRDWPTRAEIEQYNCRVRTALDTELPDPDPWVLQMAIEHRHMHAETLAYLLHQLPPAMKPHGSPNPAPKRPAPANPLVDIPAGPATLGNHTGGFGWDNEFRAHEIHVAAHQMSRYKISNGEYLEFVRDGGPAPPFWRQSGDAWLFHGMFGEIPLPLDWPVWTTWRQASAYAEWRGLTLPTEAQWLRAASLTEPNPARDNFDYLNWDPIPVDTSGDRGSSHPAQLTGNGWEWTRDVFAPFEGFQPHPLYPGYSADFFDGEHYVMKGASPRTARLLARPAFRNWFRPDYLYMYAGFRLTRNPAHVSSEN